LTLGVDPAAGILTGYYRDGPGDEDSDITPHFTCVFYLYGQKQGDKYAVQVWKPKDKTAPISGELSFFPPKKESSKPSLRLKLSQLPEGCAVANPKLGKPEGAELTLEKSGDWTAVRIVKANEAFFYDSPGAATPKKMHLNREEMAVVMDKKPGWVLLDNLIRDKGWIKEDDLFAALPGQ
jgi:hypothetical protein